MFWHNSETLNLAFTQKLLKYHMGRFCRSIFFCRIFSKCKFLLWAIELDIFKVILYSSNELYLLFSTPLAVAEGHSSSLRRRLCGISRAFGWWWGHVSHPYLRSQSRSLDRDIRVIVKIVEITAISPSGIEHAFSLVYMLSYAFLPYLSSYGASFFALLLSLCASKCFYVCWGPLHPYHPLSPSFLVVFLSFVVVGKAKSPKFVPNSKSTINVRKNIKNRRVREQLCHPRVLLR